MSVFSCLCWLPKAAFMGSFPSPPLECACSPPSALPGKLPHSGGAGCTHTFVYLLPRVQNPGPICLSGQSTRETHRHLGSSMANPPPSRILDSENGITTTPAHELELGVITAQSSSTPSSHPHMQSVINFIDVIFLLPPWATSEGRT